MSEYESVQKSALKLKGVSDSSHKKKKKRKKEKERDLKKRLEQIAAGDSGPSSADERPTVEDTMTRAERVFKESQDKKAAHELLKKAEKTHKERIMEFNNHLDDLSEHYDIPKVSWTK